MRKIFKKNYSINSLKKKKESTIKNNIISSDINKNILMLKNFFNSDINSDIVFREFNIKYNETNYKCAIILIDGLINNDSINNFILKPIMSNNKNNNTNIQNYIESNLLYQNSIKKVNTYNEIINRINIGNCVLLIDSLNICFACDVKKYEHRSISQPINEIVIKGPHQAFVESIRTNSALLRKIINDENLILEKIEIGKKSKTTCLIGYINNIANPEIINSVKKRVNNISIDYLLDSGQLEQLIEDHPLMAFPQIINTERPDKVSSHLAEGRVCIIVDNSPNVLVVPCTFWDLFHSAEDYNIKFQFSNFIRFIRLIAYAFSLFLPALYIALTNYHIDLLPTDLLFSIAAIKETIPFPLIVEVLIMEICFELIREASARMPGSVGSSIGILGAVLLGQATVDANLVSPILIFIVAITGISSFATPNYSLALGFRFLRFGYILLASLLGLYGLIFGIIIHLVFLCSIKVYNIPYMLLFTKYQEKPFRDGIILSPIWLNSFRPPFLKPLQKIKSDHISRKWNNKEKRKMFE